MATKRVLIQRGESLSNAKTTTLVLVVFPIPLKREKSSLLFLENLKIWYHSLLQTFQKLNENDYEW